MMVDTLSNIETCDHHWKFVRRFDANIEPQINKNGSYSTITDEYECRKCGKTKMNILD